MGFRNEKEEEEEEEEEEEAEAEVAEEVAAEVVESWKNSGEAVALCWIYLYKPVDGWPNIGQLGLHQHWNIKNISEMNTFMLYGPGDLDPLSLPAGIPKNTVN